MINIRKDSIRTLAITLIAISIGVSLISYINITNSNKNTEEILVKKDLKTTIQLVNQEVEKLNALGIGYSQWDDTYAFMKNSDITYIKDDLNLNAISNSNVFCIVLLNDTKNTKYSITYNSQNNQLIKIPAFLEEFIKNNSNNLTNFKTSKDPISGIVQLNNKLYLVSSTPITDNNAIKVSDGTLVVFKEFDDIMIKKIESFFSAIIRIKDIPLDKNNNTTNTLISNNINTFTVTDENTFKVKGSTTLNSINSKNVLSFEIEENRDFYTRSIKNYYYYLIMLLICISICFIINLLLLHNKVIFPLELLSESINDKNKLKNMIDNKIKKWNVETYNLAITINNMITKSERDNKHISDSEKKLRLILESANVGYWDWNIEKDKMCIDINSIKNINNEHEKIKLKDLNKIVHPDDIDMLLNIINENISNTSKTFEVEFRCLTKTNQYIWLLSKGTISKFENKPTPSRMTAIIFDITDKKNNEEKIKYLSYHDKLTGVYNRAYFENVLQDLTFKQVSNFSIIMGDINGLKITNDTFGHLAGDELLISAAQTLKNHCRKDDIVCRWGGDEFAIILLDTNEQITENICKSIKESCEMIKIEAIPLRIALGYSFIDLTNMNIAAAMKEAEHRMYRNKLFESKSVMNNIISSLEKTLAEKSNETEEHAQRLILLCMKVGEELNMANSQIDELSLLASLHDIGKIGISNDILNKPGKLDENEWEIIKTHSEIGYRIASSTTEISHIAHAILSHHEKYDGKGYPKGISGETIPLISRIISIVDAYDVMIHERPYKKPISFEETIAEIRRCSGTQFDPNLVEICIKVFSEADLLNKLKS